MIDIKKLVGKIKEVGDSEKAIVPMVQQKYIEKCGEDHAIIVVKNDIVDEVIFTDNECELLDLQDAVKEHVQMSENFTGVDWCVIGDEKMYVTWGVSIFSYKEE